MLRGCGVRATGAKRDATDRASAAAAGGGPGWGAALAAALLFGGCGDQRLIGGRTTADGSVSPTHDQIQVVQPERCNGLDDDGDGQLDEGCGCAEGATQPCYGGPREVVGIGRCARGIQTCEREAGAATAAAASWGRCEGWVGPHPQESCGDRQDDDCDGLADEDCACTVGASEACYPGAVGTVGVGVCKGGSRTCVAVAGAQGGTWGPCLGATVPAATDTCGDALDNDCDGAVDADCNCALGASEACYPGPSGTEGEGACRAGSRTCVAGPRGRGSLWGLCAGAVLPAQTEDCGNQSDDDCDGELDEGCACTLGSREPCYEGPAGTAGVGLCRRGTRSCVAGSVGQANRWSECQGSVGPAATDVCKDDGDNDCDGTVDEGCVCGLGAAEDCYDGPARTVGVGACKKGRRSCVAGAGGVGSLWDTCTGAVLPATADSCGDQVDNDCDGTADEGCICTLGTNEACYGGPAGTAGVGACRSGQRTCIAGAGGLGSRWSECTGAVLPATDESCNDRVDNDCNGAVDDGCTQVSYPDVCDVGAANSYVEAAVDPTNPATWYVLDRAGQVLRTRDAGANFTVLCRAARAYGWNREDRLALWDLREHARLVVSPASDHTVYLVLDMVVARVEELGPVADCPTILLRRLPPDHDLNYRSGGFASSPFAVSAGTGHLFAWPQNRDGLGRPVKSTDRGATWSDLAPADVTTVPFVRSLAVDPADDAHLIAFSSAGANGGIFESRNGAQWQRRATGTLSSNDVPPAIRFDPAHPGRVYVNRGSGPSGVDGMHSADGGATWVASPGHGMQGEWALEPSQGVAFRFRDLPQRAGLALERAERLDRTTPSWTTLSTFAHGLDSHARLDAAGQTVLAVVGLRLWASRDGGRSFSAPIGGGAPVVFGFSSVDSVDGNTVYATSPEWHVYRSTNGGNSFSRVYTNTHTEDRSTMVRGSARVRVFPAQPRNVIVWGPGAPDSFSFLRTTNAFQSATVGAAASQSRGALALSPTDPASAFVLGHQSGGAVSRDAGGSWTALSGLPPLGDTHGAWILPGQASSRALILGYASAQFRVFRYDANSASHVDDTVAISAALGNDTPAGIESFARGQDTIFRVIGATGWIAESTDGGAYFAGIPGSEGGLLRCYERQIRSLPADPRVVATWCSSGRSPWTSRDGGRTWAPVGGPSWEAVGCRSVEDLILTPSQLLVRCGVGNLLFPGGTTSVLVRLTY